MSKWIIIDDDYEMAFGMEFETEYEAEKFLNSLDFDYLDHSIIELEESEL